MPRAHVLLCVLAFGCGKDGGRFADACLDDEGFDSAAPASLRADVLPILQISCGLSSACHGSETPPAPNQPFLGPSMGTMVEDRHIALLLDGLVGVAAQAEPGMSLVEPGSPEASFLMYKLDGALDCDSLACAADGSCGEPMPKGSPILDAGSRHAIRGWIAQGAGNN